MNVAAEAQAPADGPDESHLRFGPTVLLPKLRSDLKIAESPVRNRQSYVVKDPVSLKYYRWGEVERRLASFLNGRRDASEVLQLMQGEFPDLELEEADIQQLMNQFLAAGFLVVDAAAAQRLIHAQRQQVGKMKRRMLWLSVLSKFISFKITLFDPDLLLLRMDRRLGWLWSKAAVIVLVLLLLGSGGLMIAHADVLAARMPDILGWENLLMMWVILILVKVVHEFGHGLSCKHYGGEVHEMGAMFILFSPFLFCNATDSWTFRKKSQRIVVNFAGIYLELFLAGVAGILWVFTEPGVFNHICFNVLLVCSVTTVLFNSNPLMKFDGYYALSDALEIPNLKERGDKALVSRLAGLFTGGEGITRDPLVESMKKTILFYAVASYLWTFMVAYSILRAIGYLMAPFGLDRIVQSAAGLTLLFGIVMPPVLVGMRVYSITKSDESGFVRKRVLWSLAVFILVLAGLAMVPVPLTVKSSCVITEGGAVRVTAPISGFLRDLSARDGQWVAAGQELAVIENVEMKNSLELAALQASIAELQEAFFVSNQGEVDAASARAVRRQYETSIAKLKTDIESGILRAPVAGRVLGRELATMPGTFVRPGDLVLEVLPGQQLEVLVALKESETGLVRPGLKAKFRLNAYADRTFSGEVSSLSPAPLQRFPHESLGQNAGGTVPSIMKPPTSASGPAEAIPAGIIYRAKLTIENPDGFLRPGMSGRVRIDCGFQPLAIVLMHKIRSMLRTDFQL